MVISQGTSVQISKIYSCVPVSEQKQATYVTRTALENTPRQVKQFDQILKADQRAHRAGVQPGRHIIPDLNLN